jgi:hypothetical protein
MQWKHRSALGPTMNLGIHTRIRVHQICHAWLPQHDLNMITSHLWWHHDLMLRQFHTWTKNIFLIICQLTDIYADRRSDFFSSLSHCKTVVYNSTVLHWFWLTTHEFSPKCLSVLIWKHLIHIKPMEKIFTCCAPDIPYCMACHEINLWFLKFLQSVPSCSFCRSVRNHSVRHIWLGLNSFWKLNFLKSRQIKLLVSPWERTAVAKNWSRNFRFRYPRTPEYENVVGLFVCAPC